MSILRQISSPGTQLAVLIDPDKVSGKHLEQLAGYADQGLIDIFLVGGSLLMKDQLTETVDTLKQSSDIPVVLFPGTPSQTYNGADALLLLSLISGRNADLLIGRHVEAAPLLRQSGLEIVPTGYILIDGGRSTTVSYISNTTPIPNHKPELVVATAIAGELLGLKALYLEAGSGALHAVPTDVIKAVKSSVNIPVIVGGGIRTPEQAYARSQAGADMIVIGTAIEEHSSLTEEIAFAIREANSVNR